MATNALLEESTLLGDFISADLDVTISQGEGLGHNLAVDFNGDLDVESLRVRVASFYASRGYEQPDSSCLSFRNQDQTRIIFLTAKPSRCYLDICPN